MENNITNKKTIIIGTTSINRPELHNKNIPSWYNWINSVNHEIYDIRWFINIDWIDKLEKSIDETKQNYLNIINNIPIYFLESETGKGNFLQACKRIAVSIEQYVKENNLDPNDVIIIWLEDDWELNSSNISLEYLITVYLSNLTYINLSFLRSNYIHALAPSIINYNLWSKIHLEAWKKQETHIDPEHCAGLYFLKKFTHYKYINNITIINKKVNEDFFNNEFMNYGKSFYTYQYDENIIVNDRYIKKEEIKEKNKDIITFIRITPSSCTDIGRTYMNDLGLNKNKSKKNKEEDFYISNK